MKWGEIKWCWTSYGVTWLPRPFWVCHSYLWQMHNICVVVFIHAVQTLVPKGDCGVSLYHKYIICVWQHLWLLTMYLVLWWLTYCVIRCNLMTNVWQCLLIPEMVISDNLWHCLKSSSPCKWVSGVVVTNNKHVMYCVMWTCNVFWIHGIIVWQHVQGVARIPACVVHHCDIRYAWCFVNMIWIWGVPFGLQ